MKKSFAAAVAVCAFLIGSTVGVLGQLPGPPVGIPQSVQSNSHGYNFQYTFTPDAADASGFRVLPTIQLPSTQSVTLDGARFGGTFTSATLTTAATLVAGLRAQTITCTVTTGVITTCANFVVDTAPTGGTTNNYAAWLKGASRIDSTISANGAANLTLPQKASSGLPILLDCGATTGSAACAATATSTTAIVYIGRATLTSNSAPITFSPAFTSSGTVQCIGSDITTRSNPVTIIPSSGSVVSINNGTSGGGAADVVQYTCIGY